MRLGKKGKDRKVMELLKNKIFEVNARIITIAQFEQWLYTTQGIAENIETNDFIMKMVSLNYKDKNIHNILEKICFEEYDQEEFLIKMIELNCLHLAQVTGSQEMWKIVNTICRYNNLESNYRLINKFYYLEDEISLAQGGLIKESVVIAGFQKLARDILSALEGLSLFGRKNILISGDIEV